MAERDPRRRSAAREQEAAPLFSEGERMFYDQDHDTEYQKKGRRKGRKKHSGSDILYTVAIIIFALIFLVSGGMSFAVRMFTLNSRWARTTSMRKGLVTAVTTRLSTLDSSLNKPKPLLLQ